MKDKSPLNLWLQSQGWTQTQLAGAANVHRTAVAVFASGDNRPHRRLYAYLAEHCPDVLAAHTQWCAEQIREVRRSLEAA